MRAGDTFDNAAFDELRETARRAGKLEREADQMRNRSAQLRERLGALEEQTDVDRRRLERLEGGGAGSLLHRITGKLESRVEELSQTVREDERQLHATKRALANATSELAGMEEEFADLRKAQVRYAKALERKRELFVSSQAEGSQRARELLDAIETLQTQRERIDEAIPAGERALAQAQEALQNLDRASGWGVYDMLGGGLIATFAKHGRLNDAQGCMDLLQDDLDEFERALRRVAGAARGIKVTTSIPLRIVDFVFDDFLTDLFVQGRIQESQDQVNGVARAIADELDELDRAAATIDDDIESLRIELDDLVANARL